MNEHERITLWRKDPLRFVLDVFGVEPDDWQVDVLSNFRRKNRICLKAAKGCGKTTVLAWLAWNFLLTRPDAKIAATSITGDNLSDGLWAEMSKWQSRSGLLTNQFIWTKTRIFPKSGSDNWFMSARSWSKTGDPSQQANALAGLHADYIMFILDESGGIPDAVMAAAEAALSTGIESKIIQAGNPTHLDGPLYRACSVERHLWHVVEVTGDPDDPKRAPRISIQWAKEQIEKYGKDNPWVLVNVFGKFPPTSINSLLGPDEVLAAMKRAPKESDYQFAQKRLGIDIARFGDDATCIFPRQGLMAYQPVIMRGARTTDIAARVMQAKSKWGSEVELIDDTGHWGHGVIDNLIAAGFAPIGIQFHGPAIDSRYKNRRAEMWLKMAEWVRQRGALPNIPELVADLTTPTYTFVNGKFQLEDKDQIKQRLGRSCDYGDALALSFSIPEAPNSTDMPEWYREQRSKALTEFDPFR